MRCPVPSYTASERHKKEVHEDPKRKRKHDATYAPTLRRGRCHVVVSDCWSVWVTLAGTARDPLRPSVKRTAGPAAPSEKRRRPLLVVGAYHDDKAGSRVLFHDCPPMAQATARAKVGP